MRSDEHDAAQPLRERWHQLTEAECHVLDVLRHHPPVARNINEIEAEHLARGERVADAAARQVGSWRFIILQSTLLVIWILHNVAGWLRHWDPYPFILLNLALSFQSADAVPVIMMSQNRQAAKDRFAAVEDYRIDMRAELEIAAINARPDGLATRQWEALLDLQQQQLALLERIERLTQEVHRTTVVARGPIER
jgi:uncharacterized membrane protein